MAMQIVPWQAKHGVFPALMFCFLLPSFAGRAIASETTNGWPAAVDEALVQADTNRQEIFMALKKTSAAERPEMEFLITNAPARDLQTLPAEFLLKNVALADAAYDSAPWKKQLPRGIFLNEILPYACVDETRDGWRQFLRNICLPLVVHCQTPGEAACRINENIFKIVNVHYSTARLKADQSPAESMANGLASCTGLSILLVDACRSVGVPARLAGTPMWTDMSGNHSWVEVWDGGWHFIGASEPDPNGVDHAWFKDKAATAIKDNPQHAIYAVSFQKTGLAFPMVWAPDVDWVHAVNVTGRYAQKISTNANDIQLQVKVLDKSSGKRVAARVMVSDDSVQLEGVSKDETADMNEVLTFEVPTNGVYKIRAQLDGRLAEQDFSADGPEEKTVVLELDHLDPLSADDEAKLKKALGNYFAASAEQQAKWKFSRRLEKLLAANEPAVRELAWETFKAAPVHDALKQAFDDREAHFQNYTSPYTVKYVGRRQTNGWALFIAMHGGGGVAKEVNDSQWKIMQRYYRNHPEAGGYIYLAVRAPNDTWNGFYDDYMYPLMANLVHELLIFGEVDPDKVFIMGYSHGGYGAFAIGPKEPDLFAAIHASAAAPTEGETTAKTLRNTVFSCMVGDQDNDYGRHERDEKFKDTVAQLRGERTDIYPVTVDIIKGNGHTGLPDRDLIRLMYPTVRDPAPRELTWLMTDSVITDFFWLHTDVPAKQEEIDAACRDNQVTVTTTNVTSATVFLDSRLVDFSKPVKFDVNGKTMVQKLQPSLRTLCETLQHRCDPGLAFTAEVPLPLTREK